MTSKHMIPKIIHFCWFGKAPLPKLAKHCIQSWKKYLPDYQIKEWNEDNFDVNSCQYVADAYKEKKYAFVSDYVRFFALYQYGGIYLDTDVELIKPMVGILNNGAFMGCENTAGKGEQRTRLRVAPGLGIGAEARMPFYKEMIDLYNELSFYNNDGTLNLQTIVDYTTERLRAHGFIDEDIIQDICGIKIYPKEYFCPIDYWTGEKFFTSNTVSIHYYVGSWLEKDSPMIALRRWLIHTFGDSFYQGLRRVKLCFFPKPWYWK